MKKIKILLIFSCLLVFLSGCSSLTGRSEELVENYNNRVVDTLALYDTITKTATETSDTFLDFLVGSNDEYKEKGYNIDLIREEIGEGYLVQKNKLFTSMDSNYVKQILLLYNNGKQYYYEVIWTTDGVESITGRVI